ncbi:carbonic anhydrase family protein [Stenotrophomonas maltophilia]|nr:carbonic anhydrase family protein [Stenotrophomonas maltophilia]
MHTPSEHYVDGKRHAMELHLAHASTTGKTAVDASVHRRRALEHRADAAPFQCRNRAHCAASEQRALAAGLQPSRSE